MTAYGVSDTSFVMGDLEDWTKGALIFDGSSTWCSLSHSSSSERKSNNVDMTTNNFILETYMKTIEDHTEGVLISKFGSSGKGYQLDINPSGQIRISLMENGSPEYSLSSSDVINDGGWHHVVVTISENATNSSSYVRVYIDGQNNTEESADVDPLFDIVADLDVTIGYRPSQDDRGFQGDLDDVRIYNRVLSPEEAAWLAGRTKAFDKPF